MRQIKSVALKAACYSFLALSGFASVSSAEPIDPFHPDLGPGLPDFGSPSAPMYCKPVGEMPDFCIPDFGPAIPDPFQDIDLSQSIAIRYQVIDAASDLGDIVSDQTLEVYAIDPLTGEVIEAKRGGWIVLPRPGIYTFGADSAFCSVPSKKVRVTRETRQVRLSAFCEG